MKKDVLIIGGGITGVQSALDLAEKGYEVVIVDKSPSIGGNMVKLDKTFPTNDCSICISSPKMVEASRNENIDILTYSEVKEVLGSAGRFNVKIWKKTKYVDPDICTGCGDCADACPVQVPSEFEQEMSYRKAIYVEYPQSVPLTYTIDYDHCVGCCACERICDADAIDFLEKSREIEIEVGSIIVATGYEMMQPQEWRDEYGYTRYDNVYTALEFERLMSASGPTGGKPLKRSDGKEPESIAWIQCVGSRCKQKGMPYCSRVCCMYATKQASITKSEMSDVDTSIYYMDMRTYGKDFQQYYDKAKKKGVNYIRGRPSRIYEEPDGSLAIEFEDTEKGEVKTDHVDMVVLSSAIMPSSGNEELSKILDIELDENGFFQSKEDLTDAMDSSREGIYLAGCAQSPKDIPDSVAQGSGAAGRALEPLKGRERWKKKTEKTPEKDVSDQEPRIGVFVCHCGKNIANYLDVNSVSESVKDLPGVVYVNDSVFACSEDAQKLIKEAIDEHDLNRIVVSACSPRTHEQVFQQTLEEAGLNKYLFEMANIRNMCSWVHSDDNEKATKKAEILTKMAVAKARRLYALTESEIDVGNRTLVIGGGPAGMRTALSLSQTGQEVTLVEKEDRLGGKLNELDTLFPSEIDAEKFAKELIHQIDEEDIRVITSAKIEGIDGYIGNYEVTVNEEEIEVDTIVLATGFQEIDPKDFYSYGEDDRIMTQLELDRSLKKDELEEPKDIVFINCVGALEEERPWCCRVGCGNSLKNAKEIKRRYPDANVYILYKDMRVFGKKEEEYYMEVEGDEGVIFLRYSTENEPEIEVGERIGVKVHDNLLDEDLEIDADYLVLAMQLEGDSSVNDLKKMLKVASDPASFYMEAHAKLRPLEFPSEGVYLAGGAHYPKNVADTLAQAEGAASKALVPMMKGYSKSEGIISVVDDDLCSGCKMCISVCPYGAIEHDPEDEIAKITDVLCKGCGACASVCPIGAIDQKGYDNETINAMIQAALMEEEVM